MSKNHEIQALELKIVASRRVQTELDAKLEKLQMRVASPAPSRRQLIKKRLQEIEDFYTKRNLKKAI